MNIIKTLAIIGGETHLGEISGFIGSLFDLKAVCVKEKYYKDHFESLGVPNIDTCDELLETVHPEVVAISNENDLKKDAIIKSVRYKAAVIADKPLAITSEGQEEIEEIVRNDPYSSIIMLLTLRGEPVYRKMREIVMDGRIGDVAFCHVRMSVQMKRDQRPSWFLDYRQSGGLFPDLLIHGLDIVEWTTGSKVVGMYAVSGNMGHKEDTFINDHASVYIMLDNGGSAIVEGQRLMPPTEAADYRMLVSGTNGYAELDMMKGMIALSDKEGSKVLQEPLPKVSVVEDWYNGGELITTPESLRANRLALLAAASSKTGKIMRL